MRERAVSGDVSAGHGSCWARVGHGGSFWRIQVPLLRPVLGFLLVWLTINALQLFDEVYATTKGGPVHSTTVVVHYLYQEAFQFFHAGYAAAIATALFAAIALITVVQLRLTRGPSATGEGT